MFWLFNKDKVSLHEEEGKHTISWEQSRNFKGQEGDRVVFYSYEAGTFESLYDIDSVSHKVIPLPKGQLFQFQVVLSLVESYEEKEIGNYIYSFPRVRHYGNRLYYHFNRKYYRLSEIEFNAIDQNEIFISRTILGNVLNALHLDHRKAFAIYLAENYPGVVRGDYKNSDVLNYLNEYLKFAVITPARQLSAAYDYLSKWVDKDILNQIGFHNEGKKEDLIEVQNNIIGKFLESYQDINKSIQTEGVQYQPVFEKLFRNAQLPINFN